MAKWEKEQQSGVRIWLLGYYRDPPLLGRQEKKKCVHMPYNLQTATIEARNPFQTTQGNRLSCRDQERK